MKALMQPPQPQLEGHLPLSSNGTPHGEDQTLTWISSFPPELGFTSDEESRGLTGLFHLLRAQVQWATEESENLKSEVEIREALRKREWMEKEIVLDQVVKTEVSWQERRKMILAGHADVLPTGEVKTAMDGAWNNAYTPPYAASTPGGTQVKVQPVEDQRDAAAVLASLQHA